jgi:hypothetical protein
MRSRVFHDTASGDAFDRVLIIHRAGEDAATVYCPPMNGEKAYSETFPTRAEADAFASLKAGRLGQRVIPLTADRVEWWLPLSGTSDSGG